MQNPNYLSYYLIDRHLLGFATGTQPHGDQPWWYYLPLLLGGGLPWIGYLPAAVRRQGTGARGQGSAVGGQGSAIGSETGLSPDPRSPPLDPRPLLWCWLVGWLLFLTVARSKLVTYLWPAFPPVAILAALAWAGAIDGTLGRKARGSLARTFVFSSLSGPVVLPLALLVLQAVFGLRYGWPVWAAVATVAAAAPLPLVPWCAGRAQAGLVAAVLCVSAQFVVAMTTVLPPAAEIYSARALAEHFNHLGRLPARLYMAEERIGSLVFYLDPRLRAGLKRDQVVQVRAPNRCRCVRATSWPCPTNNDTGPPAGSISTAIRAKRSADTGYIASLTKVPEPGAVIPLERSAAFVQLAFPCVCRRGKLGDSPARQSQESLSWPNRTVRRKKRTTASVPPMPEAAAQSGASYAPSSFEQWREKGDRHHLCAAPSGPFRQMVSVPFFLGFEQ